MLRLILIHLTCLTGSNIVYLVTKHHLEIPQNFNATAKQGGGGNWYILYHQYWWKRRKLPLLSSCLTSEEEMACEIWHQTHCWVTKTYPRIANVIVVQGDGFDNNSPNNGFLFTIVVTTCSTPQIQTHNICWDRCFLRHSTNTCCNKIDK